MKKNGSRVKRLCPALVASVATALALAGPASAHGTGGVVIHYDNASAMLKGTHGYKVMVSGTGDIVGATAYTGPLTLLKAGKTPSGSLASSYTVDGTSGPKVMKADLGKFGEVDLEFHAQKTSHPKPPKGCHGQLTLKKGVWKGTFKFKGEHRYTKASAEQIDGKYEGGSVTCEALPGDGNGKTYVELTASTVQPKANENAFFEASKRKSGGKPKLNASLSESKGPIQIYRSAYVTGKSGDFTNTGYTQAKVKGRGAFSGTGNYDNGDWTGGLKVKFPGETLGLTGAGYVANLSEETFKAPPADR